jgi:hypothetical protein
MDARRPRSTNPYQEIAKMFHPKEKNVNIVNYHNAQINVNVNSKRSTERKETKVIDLEQYSSDEDCYFHNIK